MWWGELSKLCFRDVLNWMCILRCQQEVCGCWKVISSSVGLNSIYFAEFFSLMSRCWKRQFKAKIGFWHAHPSQSSPCGTDCKPMACHLPGREMSSCWTVMLIWPLFLNKCSLCMSCSSAGLLSEMEGESTEERRQQSSIPGSSCSATAITQQGMSAHLGQGGGLWCKK